MHPSLTENLTRLGSGLGLELVFMLVCSKKSTVDFRPKLQVDPLRERDFVLLNLREPLATFLMVVFSGHAPHVVGTRCAP